MQLKTEIEINASAEQAWEVLGEGFGSIADWTSSLISSSLEGNVQQGAVRMCESATAFGPFKAGVVKERLIVFDPNTMTFEYEAISGLPGFVRCAGNRWSIHKIDDQHCMVRFVPKLELRGLLNLLAPLMIRMAKKDIDKLAEEIRYRIANGRPHPRKCQQLREKEAISKPVT